MHAGGQAFHQHGFTVHEPQALKPELAACRRGSPRTSYTRRRSSPCWDSLKRRAIKLHKMLSSLQGVTCTEPEGALYAMPQIRLPKAAIEVGACACTLHAAQLSGGAVTCTQSAVLCTQSAVTCTQSAVICT